LQIKDRMEMQVCSTCGGHRADQLVPT